MICTIEGDAIKCVIDHANTVYKPNTAENRQALGLEDKPIKKKKEAPPVVEEDE